MVLAAQASLPSAAKSASVSLSLYGGSSGCSNWSGFGWRWSILTRSTCASRENASNASRDRTNDSIPPVWISQSPTLVDSIARLSGSQAVLSSAFCLHSNSCNSSFIVHRSSTAASDKRKRGAMGRLTTRRSRRGAVRWPGAEAPRSLPSCPASRRLHFASVEQARWSRQPARRLGFGTRWRLAAQRGIRWAD